MEKPKIVSMKDALESPLSDDDVPELPKEPSPAPKTLPVSESSIAEPRPILPLVSSPSLNTPAPLPVHDTSSVVPTPSSTDAKVYSPPAGSPPWVESNGPIPSYPGVGRPRVTSISQAGSAPAIAQAPLVPERASGKLYERPELDAERFAHELTEAKPVSAMPSVGTPSPLATEVVNEYRKTASADLKKPGVPTRPMTPQDERTRAKMLAEQIHQVHQKAGLLGQIKRMIGLR